MNTMILLVAVACIAGTYAGHIAPAPLALPPLPPVAYAAAPILALPPPPPITYAAAPTLALPPPVAVAAAPAAVVARTSSIVHPAPLPLKVW